MNNFDSIKLFINIQFSILLICLGIINIVNLLYWIENFYFSLKFLFEGFLLYFLIDLIIDFNDEKNLFLEKHHTYSRYKVVRIIRKI